jgi:Spy/CpxP family protein refolding chaperone
MVDRTIRALSLGALLAMVTVAASVWAHGGGPGGYGPGYGYGYGMGPGMMGGYGTMHGPGMMGGYGMYGPGMMGGGYGMGPGMMGGYGMYGPGMMGMGPVWMLNLTDEQRAKISKLQEQLRKKQWTTMGQIMDERQKLYELYSAENPDPKKVGAVYGKIFDLRRQMIEAAIDTQNRAQAVLTQEQRAQLEQWRHGWGPGGPGVMGPGTMGPGMMGPGPRHGMGG